VACAAKDHPLRAKRGRYCVTHSLDGGVVIARRD
jgi:hypothetical protein